MAASKSKKPSASTANTRDQNKDETKTETPRSGLSATLNQIEFAAPRKNKMGLAIATGLLLFWIFAIATLALVVNF